MYSGITSGRVLNGELLYTKILEVNLFAFAYRLFRRDFSPLDGTYCMGTHSFLQKGMSTHARCPVGMVISLLMRNGDIFTLLSLFEANFT